MPSCTYVFTLADENVSQFRATFQVKQDCQDGDEQEVIVSTPVTQRPHPVSVSVFFLVFGLIDGPGLIDRQRLFISYLLATSCSCTGLVAQSVEQR